jgi:hypothetical protein
VSRALGVLTVLALAGCGSSSPTVEISGPPKFGTYDHFLNVTRPAARRPPTSAERNAIVAATRAYHHLARRDACYRYLVTVSTLDSNWAEVEYRFDRGSKKNCLLGNGRTIMWKRDAVWRVKGDAGDAFDCDYGPAGVIAGLDGSCWVVLSRKAYVTAPAVAPIKRELQDSRAVQRLGRSRLLLNEAWISANGVFAAADISGTRVADPLTRTALLRRTGRHWHVVELAVDPDWCRYAPPDVLREIHLADGHC